MNFLLTFHVIVQLEDADLVCSQQCMPRLQCQAPDDGGEMCKLVTNAKTLPL